MSIHLPPSLRNLMTSRFYVITGCVVVTLAMISNVAFGIGFDLFDDFGHRHWHH